MIIMNWILSTIAKEIGTLYLNLILAVKNKSLLKKIKTNKQMKNTNTNFNNNNNNFNNNNNNNKNNNNKNNKFNSSNAGTGLWSWSNLILWGMMVGVIIVKIGLVDYASYTWWDKFLFGFFVSFSFTFITGMLQSKEIKPDKGNIINSNDNTENKLWKNKLINSNKLVKIILKIIPGLFLSFWLGTEFGFFKTIYCEGTDGLIPSILESGDENTRVFFNPQAEQLSKDYNSSSSLPVSTVGSSTSGIFMGSGSSSSSVPGGTDDIAKSIMGVDIDFAKIYETVISKIVNYLNYFFEPVQHTFTIDVMSNHIKNISLLLFILTAILLIFFISLLFNVILNIFSDRLMSYFTNKYIL